MDELQQLYGFRIERRHHPSAVIRNKQGRRGDDYLTPNHAIKSFDGPEVLDSAPKNGGHATDEAALPISILNRTTYSLPCIILAYSQIADS